MSLRINDVAPDFTAETTQGTINFHEWIGDGWAILFSHPKDFTPVCTTELGYMARIEPEFAKRNTKLIGLSVDPVDSHNTWAKDIEETQGHLPKYPMIGDPELKISKLYNMLPAAEPDSSQGRTAAQNQTVRSVFVVGPDKKIKLMLTYPMTTGRNFDEILRVLDSMQLTAEAPGRNAGQLEAGRRRDHCRLGVRRRGQEAVPGRLEGAETLSAYRPATRPLTAWPGRVGNSTKRDLIQILQASSRQQEVNHAATQTLAGRGQRSPRPLGDHFALGPGL